MKTPKRIDYGIDAPTLIRNFYISGLILLGASFFLPALSIFGLSVSLKSIACSFSITFLLTASLMFLYSKKGKLKHRDRILNLFKWTGKENVLDVGTGLGLLMNGAAKQLTNGKVIGIDIWDQKDLSNNTVAKTKLNAEIERVSDKIEIRNQNILSTNFREGYFDVVLSNLCLHNIHGKERRQKACKEIYRVMKQNGTAIISDLGHAKEYKAAFSKLGMDTKKIGTYYFTTFPPLTIIKAVKK